MIMLGMIAEQTTRPAVNGELLRDKTSIGKAIVDMRLPYIDIEEPNMRTLKARFLPSL
jgi:hypothetical protein